MNTEIASILVFHGRTEIYFLKKTIYNRVRMENMKFFYKRTSFDDSQNDLKIVQDTLNSGYFIMIDLLFWALFLTIFSPPAQHSIRMAFMIFIGFYVSGLFLFMLLRECLKRIGE